MAGISLAEFWDLTPNEIRLAVEGYHRRLRHRYEVSAFGAAVVANALGGKTSPHDLLPPSPWED